MQRLTRVSLQSLLAAGFSLVILLLIGFWVRGWLVQPGDRASAGATTLPSQPAIVAAPPPSPVPAPVDRPLPPAPPRAMTSAVVPVVDAKSNGPRAGGPPVSAMFVHNPQKSMVNGVHFLNHGQQLGRFGGKLNRDDKGNFTGNSYLDVCDLPDGSPTFMCENNGFPCFNAAFTTDGHRALFSCIDWGNQGHSHLYLADFADDFGGATVKELEFITGWEFAIAISGDGQLAATHQTSSQQVHLWDLNTRKQTGILELGTAASVLQFDSSGKHLITAGGYSGDSSLQIWDTTTQKQLAKCLGHTNDLRALAISADDSTIASADSDGAIWLWANPTGKAIDKFECRYQTVSALDFSPDGKRLLATTDEATDETAKKPWIRMNRIRVWDIASGKELIKFEKADIPITAATFDKEGTSILVFQGSQVKTYGLPTDLPQPSAGEIANRAVQTLTVPVDGEIASFDCDTNWAVSFGNGDKGILTGGMGGFTAWDWPARKKASSFSCQMLHLINPTADIGISEETHDQHGFAVVYQLSTSKKLATIDPEGFGYIDLSALSQDGKLVALATGCVKERISPVFKPQLQIFNSADGSVVSTVTQHTDDVRCMAFSPDARCLYVAGGWRDNDLHDAAIRRVNIATGMETQICDGLSDIPKAMVLSQDGKQLWIVGEWGTPMCFDTATGALRSGPGLGQAWSVAISPDGKRLAVGLMGNIAILDAANCQTIARLRRHHGPVMSMAFSSDGTHLVSVATDKTVRVFDVQKAINDQR